MANNMPTPPTNALGGPPPGTSATGLSQMSRGADPQGGGPAPSGGGGGLTKVFFNVEEQLDAIAQALPESSGEIDRIKTQLRALLAKAVPTGPTAGSPKKSLGSVVGPNEPEI